MALTRRLAPVPFTRVTVDDAFWAPRIETNRAVTIPAEYAMCEGTGRVAAFDLAWKPGDPNPPHIFWDSDVAKWIEAASYSLATTCDPALDALLDTVIARIARAQQPDGYLNTHYTAVEPDRRWSNLRDCHELYCAGHMIEAAVAHYQATGKRSLLDVLCRYADLIGRTFGRGPSQTPGYCGHEEIELALVKLYHATGERRYLELAQYFVDERGCTAHDGAPHEHYYDLEARARGDDPRRFWARTYAYMQALVPVRAQSEVTGHAVRAMYLFSAMADLANESGDRELLAACERLWSDLCDQRMYITGGIGPSASNEGFTEPFDLPDETAYAETCAAVGLVFWAHRLLHVEGNGRYADVMERALYNGAISGVALDGKSFFYVNPLASRGGHHRQGWFDCACCPPNIARLVASVGGYVYSEGDADAWVHLYVQGQGRLRVGGAEVVLDQETLYPWDGRVRIEVGLPEPQEFTLHLRIPGWCDRWAVTVNGEPAAVAPENGYIAIRRRWMPGDGVNLALDMPAVFVRAHPRVRQMIGRVAVQRGPVVYCLEGADHDGAVLDRVIVDPASALDAQWQPDLLGGVVVLRGRARIEVEDEAPGALYRRSTPSCRPAAITAIPYCTWDNRAPGEMRVWFRAEV